MSTNIFELLQDTATDLPHLEVRQCCCPGCGGAQMGGGASVSAATVASAAAGTYDQMATFLTTGYWGGPSQSGQWDTRTSNVITVDLTGLTAEGQQLARWALEAWEMVADLQFVEVSGNADITFTDHNSGAYAGWSSSGGYITSAYVNIHESWLEGATTDSYAYSTYIHEIGHALGLGHMGPYDGNAIYGLDEVFANDSWQVSIMSYFDQTDNTSINASYANLLTPMLVDIIAIQNLYGAPSETTSATAGDTTWGGSSSTLGNYLDPTFDGLSGSFTTVLLGDPIALTIYDVGGIDTVDLSYSTTNDVIDLRAETFSNVGGLIGNVAVARGTVLENALTGSGNDRITGNSADNHIESGDGADTVNGGIGDDTIMGDAGDDLLIGLHGDDVLEGGDGNDTLRGNNDHDLIDGGAGEDSVIGGTGRDTIYGGDDNDVLRGTGGFDTLDGGLGNDTLYGGVQADLVLGGEGNDILFARGGFDTLNGGAGNDRLQGDFNADTFVFEDGHGNDTITDFEATNDFEVIDFSQVSTLNNTQDVLDAATQQGGNVLIDTGGGNSILLIGVDKADLDANDFLF